MGDSQMSKVFRGSFAEVKGPWTTSDVWESGYGWVEQNTVSEKCFFVALVGFMCLPAVCETKNNPWLKCFMVPVGHITFWP